MSGKPSTRSGWLMYRQLPEEYRFRDEDGDLADYLDGIGVLLDGIRRTLEQSYADAFAMPEDPAPAAGPGAVPPDPSPGIQPWVMPYLAELFAADLWAPEAGDRASELLSTVGWYKTKGTMPAIDQIADTVAGFETVPVEGWQRVLTTPRNWLPPFSEPARRAVTPPPLGTPDLRFANRAVADDAGTDPVRRLRLDGKEAYWRPSAPQGVPAFAGRFDDCTPRTPDLRDAGRVSAGPQPRRLDLYVRPPDGFFSPGLPVVTSLNPLPAPDGGHDPLVVDPARFHEAVLGAAGPVRYRFKDDLTVPAGADIVFRDMVFDGILTIGPDVKSVRLERCALAWLKLDSGDSQTLRVSAEECLIGAIEGASAQLRLIYVTVLEDADIFRLEASDCLFAGGLRVGDPSSRIRFSRLPPEAELPQDLVRSATNTSVRPRFELRYGTNGRLQQPPFGMPGAGVLADDCPAAISAGAEDGRELGAYHERHYAARLSALRHKLIDFLPLGQSVSVTYDERLSVLPPRHS